jgi:hypothetical protein
MPKTSAAINTTPPAAIPIISPSVRWILFHTELLPEELNALVCVLVGPPVVVVVVLAPLLPCVAVAVAAPPAGPVVMGGPPI